MAPLRCKARVLGCPRCVLPASPLPPRAARGPKQFAGGWGAGRRLRAGSSLHSAGRPPRAAGLEDHQARPLPTHFPAQPTPLSLPSCQAQGGSSWVQPPQSGPSGRWPGRGGGGGIQWSHCPEAAPLKHKHFLMWWLCGAAAGAAPWGCWTRPGGGDHPGLRGGPLPNGIPASSYGLDKAERPPALIFVPWNVSHVSPGGSGHCF